ncbi:MAG: SPFH domain-containing protein [Planctomycetota bacterium]
MHQHADHHHQDRHGDHDQQEHHAPGVIEAPLDAANQSLSDALRASFGILKGIMCVLVVLYACSNIQRVDGHEQAMLLRVGALLPNVYDAGLVWAFPYPVDEMLRLPTRKSNELSVESHTFQRLPEEVGKPISFIARGPEGLNPGFDGALLTADAGLVHVQWKVFYKIEDLASYVTNVLSEAHLESKKLTAAEYLIRLLVETAGIHVAGQLTAEEILRTRVDFVQSSMVSQVNERLRALHSGLNVTRIEMLDPTPPIAVRQAFDDTQRAENTKQKKMHDAEQERTKLLNATAGAAYPRLVALLEEIEAGERIGMASMKTKSRRTLIEARAELDQLLNNEVEGRAGRMIKDAGSYLSAAVGKMQSDVERYRTLVPEYERNPELLVGRLWEQTKQRIFNHDGVTKVFRPDGSQIRLKIPFDPRQARKEESRRLQEQEFDPSKLRPQRWVPAGPESE